MGWMSCAVRDLAARQEDDGRDAGGGAVGRQRRRGVAGGGAGHGADRRCRSAIICLTTRDQHGHAQVLERAGVAVAAQS